jgi:trimethylamine corrinoid protein
LKEEVEALERVKRALVELEEATLGIAVEEALSQGLQAEAVLNALSEGMTAIGERYERGEYFLAEMIIGAEMFKEAAAELEPTLQDRGVEPGRVGVVVLGTVMGDIHDLGKNLVATMLRAAGFEVIDLGVDVSAEDFADAAAENDADIVGLSSLLSTTLYEMKGVVDVLRDRGIRGRVKVIVGGLPTSPEFAKEIGADAHGRDAIQAVERCRDLIEERFIRE